MTLGNIDRVRGAVSELVSQTIIDTFHMMFGQEVTGFDLVVPGSFENGKTVFSSIRLHQQNADVEFCFSFDVDLLLRAASLIFSEDYLRNNPVHQELACEIANIVCSKVKAFLGDNGFESEMGFPYVPETSALPFLQTAGGMVHMHFYYNGPNSDQDVGVTVNFFMDKKS